MEALQFKLSGKSAFFKKPEVNTYGYFTYGNIHKVALLGIFGAILGYGGYAQTVDILANNKRKRTKAALEKSYPEFYDKLQNLKIAILPCAKKGVIPKKMQIFNNSVGYASQEQGGNLIVKQQWLENPAWQICVLLDCDEANKLKQALGQKVCKYYPYLGSNDHFADITDVRVVKLAEVKQEKYRINSFILKNNITWLNYLDEEDLTDDELLLYDNFKYEEALPYALDAYTNNYILAKFVYTGLYIDVKNKPVYQIENKKQIVFY